MSLNINCYLHCLYSKVVPRLHNDSTIIFYNVIIADTVFTTKFKSGVKVKIKSDHREVKTF